MGLVSQEDYHLEGQGPEGGPRGGIWGRGRTWVMNWFPWTVLLYSRLTTFCFHIGSFIY